MNTTIYHNTKAQGIKAFRYAYEDDPTFLAFRSAVWSVCDRNEQPNLNNSTLYGLWYVSQTFHRHWHERPSKKPTNNLVYILGHNLLTYMQSGMVLVAWLEWHFPNITGEALEDFERRFVLPTWDRIQPSVQAARDRKNARRREKRRTKKMKTQNTKRNSTLRHCILEALKLHPMTTAVLAKKLDAHPKAVDGHLSRMSKPDRAEVVKLGRGLYALSGVDYSVPTQSAQPDRPTPFVEPITLASITEGVDEWDEPEVRESSWKYGVVMSEEGVWDAPNLKSAEPKWSRNW